MSDRGDTNKRPLPDYTYDCAAVPPKSLDGQYPRTRKSADLNNIYGTEEIPHRRRERHEELQGCSERRRILDANDRAYRAFAEIHDVHAGISLGERLRKERLCRDKHSTEEDEPCPYTSPKSAPLYSEDQYVLFESPLYSGGPAGPLSNPYDASSSEYHRKPVAYAQPSARGEASSSSPRLGVSRQNTLRSDSPRSGLRRTDTYDESTDSLDPFSNIPLTDPLDEDYDYVLVEDRVKVPSRHKKDWWHPFG